MGKRRKKKGSILKKLIALLVIFILMFIIMCILTKDMERGTENTTGESTRIENLELPSPIAGEEIIKHTGYTLSYNEENELPSYVAYELTKDEVLGPVERNDSFREDPYVRTGSATLEDYRGSGYDRGHMAPAADFKWSEKAMEDTFYMSQYMLSPDLC